MTDYTQQDRTIALIGLYQVAKQVYDLATTGKTDETAFEASVNSLFNENPTDTLDVFGNVDGIQLGTETLLAQMASDKAVSSRNIEITKYVLSLMILEKKISEQEGLLEKVFRVIESAKNNRSHFGDFHENIIATLARAYSENISQVNPRIMVNGAHGHLQNPKIANKIRALLLAGIRASMLWRQVGGSRWGLLWSRKKYLASAQTLVREPVKD
jgi:high frequency lysogenization protein